MKSCDLNGRNDEKIQDRGFGVAYFFKDIHNGAPMNLVNV
jgi:hypothetical protein